jgi:hypothetical protein
MPERFADTPDIAGGISALDARVRTSFPAESERQQTKRTEVI